MVVLPGLMLAIMLAMLDNMIVSTAMPRIVGELDGLEHFSWVVTAYILGTTVSTPIWGKLGDLYGRKGIFLISIVIFLVGSGAGRHVARAWASSSASARCRASAPAVCWSARWPSSVTWCRPASAAATRA